MAFTFDDTTNVGTGSSTTGLTLGGEPFQHTVVLTTRDDQAPTGIRYGGKAIAFREFCPDLEDGEEPNARHWIAEIPDSDADIAARD